MIRQSTISTYSAYQRGEVCGLQLQAQLQGNYPHTEQTEAQRAGWWFEDMLARGESQYQMTTLKNGDPNALFRQLWRHLETGKRMMATLPQYRAGEMLERGCLSGTPDIVTIDGRVIDIKTTAHLNNKFDRWGWGALLEDPESYRYRQQIETRRVQALTYCFLSRELAPVYEPANVAEFWVFSTNSDDARVFRFEFTPEEVEAWGIEVCNINDQLQLELVTGFDPLPEFNRCRECPLRHTCESAHLLPTIINIK